MSISLSQHERSAMEKGSGFYYGLHCQQNPAAFVSINRLLNAHHFDTIIELGTHTAGLSIPLALYCHLSRFPAQSDNPAEASLFVNRTHHRSPKLFYTFDNVIRDKMAIMTIQHLGGLFYQRDTLGDQETIDEIRGLIREGGSTLLLCDGGNKKRELDLYGGSLKSGDCVMLHDWAFDEAAFERNKQEGVWFSHETMWTDGEGEGRQFGIKILCERYGIEQVYADEFDRVAWFAGRKR